MVSAFSTREIDPAAKHSVWGEKISRFVGSIDILPNSDQEFDGQYRLGGFGFAKLAKMAFGPVTAVRTREMIRRDGDRCKNRLNVIFQLQGRALLEQNGTQVWLNPGDWTVFDLSQPYTLSNSEQNQQLGMLVRREELALSGLRPALYLDRRFSTTDGIGKVAFDFLMSVQETMSEPAGYRSNTALELLRLAIVSQSKVRELLSAKELLRQRVKSYVDQHLRDPDLSIDGIAKAMNCTKRYLHKIFSDDTMTLSHHIWESRLAGCRESLLDPGLRGWSVTDVAFSWGFNNSAHFSSRFKMKFGVVPTSCRSAKEH